MGDLELTDCVIPPDKQGMVAQRVFGKHCADGKVEMAQEEFEAAMAELGVTDFHSDRDGAHDIFVKCNHSVTRTKFGSLRFVRAKTRHMTDVPCLLLFLGYLVAMGAVADFGLRHGNPQRLLYATDYNGSTCGRGALAATPLIFYPELEADMVKFAIMVAADPKKAKFSNFQSAGKCVAACPAKGAPFEMGGAAYKVGFEQKEVMMRCFSQYPKSPLYFAKCKAFAANASTAAAAAAAGAAAAPPSEGTCAQYVEEWTAPGGAGNAAAVSLRDRLCSELTGDWRSVICLTKTAPCDSLMRTYYDSKRCCAAAMGRTYPHCETYTLGSGNYNENPLMENPVFQKMMAAAAAVGRAFGDMTRSASLILLCGGLFTVFQGVVWSGLVQLLARPIVIATLTVSVLMPLFISLFFYAKGGLLDGNARFVALRSAHGLDAVFGVPDEATRPDLLSLEQEIEAYKGCGYAFNALWVGLALYLIHLRNFIRVAIGMIKEASRALRQMPLMIAFPLFPVAAIFGLCLYFMYVAVHIASIESLSNVYVATDGVKNVTAALGDKMADFRQFTGAGENSTISTLVSSLDKFRGNLGDNVTITPSQQMEALLWVHGAGFLWCMNVVNGIWCCTVAGAMCRWYWKFQEDKDHKEFEHMITWMSFKKTVRYFLGSVCYGAALISLMQLIRIGFEYLMQQSKKMTKDPRLAKVAKLAMAVRVCLMAAQRAVEEMTQGALIMVVMQGCSFCVGARESRQLFKVHAKLIATTQVMANIVLGMARLCVVVTSVLLMFVCLEGTAVPELGLLGLAKPRISSPIVPTVVCGLFSLAVVNCYIDIFSTTITALLLSYAADRELNDQTGMYAMTTALKNFITGDENPPFKGVDQHDPDDKTIPQKKGQRGGAAGDDAATGNPVHAEGFAAADANQDGVLDQSEFAAHQKDKKSKDNPLGLDSKTLGIISGTGGPRFKPQMLSL